MTASANANAEYGGSMWLKSKHHCSSQTLRTLTKAVIYIRYTDRHYAAHDIDTILYAIDTTLYRRCKTVVLHHLLCHQSSIFVLVTTRLGVLVLVSQLQPLLYFPPCWLLAVLLHFFVCFLLCGG